MMLPFGDSLNILFHFYLFILQLVYQITELATRFLVIAMSAVLFDSKW